MPPCDWFFFMAFSVAGMLSRYSGFAFCLCHDSAEPRGQGGCLTRHRTGRAPDGAGHTHERSAECISKRVRESTSVGRGINLSPRTRETKELEEGHDVKRDTC